MANSRQFWFDSPQGEDERLAYTIDTTRWQCTAPTGVAVYLYSIDGVTGAKTDVSSTKLSGAASVAGAVITTPLVVSLTAGTLYRMEVQWVYNGNTLEGFGYLEAEE
jgi:hypothetical protein